MTSAARVKLAELLQVFPGKLSGLAGYLIFIPVFFQLGHGLFTHTDLVFNSGGSLAELPLPVSAPAALALATTLVFRGEKPATLVFTISFYALLLISTLIAPLQEAGALRKKTILLAQYALPYLGLLAGRYAYGRPGREKLARQFFSVLLLVVPLQLLATGLSHEPRLVPHIFFFSVYQSLQYVPVIFAAAYIYALFALGDAPKWRPALWVFLPLMGVYSAASISITTTVLLCSGVAMFLLARRAASRYLLLALSALLFSVSAYLFLSKGREELAKKYTFLSPAAGEFTLKGLLPGGAERLSQWAFYAEKLRLSSPSELAFGHPLPPSRETLPSAHNYFLDLLYNFGLFPLLALLGYLGYILRLAFRRRSDIAAAPGLCGLAFVTLFLVLVDNFLKVGLRQPYPGIFTLYLLGFLAGELERTP